MKTGAQTADLHASDTARLGQDAIRQEARERLKAGSHAYRRLVADDPKAQASKTWHLWVVFDILLLLLAVPLVVAVPPVLECRRIQQEVGFFAGNSLETCVRAGISKRWDHLDSRLKMLVRGSGQ